MRALQGRPRLEPARSIVDCHSGLSWSAPPAHHRIPRCAGRDPIKAAETDAITGKLEDLARQLERKTANELGEGAEIDLFESLKQEFGGDQCESESNFDPTPISRQVAATLTKL
jgi:hypothetical protein